VVLSTTLSEVSWPSAQIVRNVAELRTLKDQPGKNAYVVGGATLVTSLLNEDLLDELRLIVHPIILGTGRSLFGAVTKRRSLDLIEAKPTTSGRLVVNYRVIP
jgi:dihydrofolate reductase